MLIMRKKPSESEDNFAERRMVDCLRSRYMIENNITNEELSDIEEYRKFLETYDIKYVEGQLEMEKRCIG